MLKKERKRLLPVLLAATMFVSCLSLAASPNPYKKTPTETYRLVVPSDKVVAIAQLLAFPDFPKVQDIIAIARVESTFIASARNGISNGIMQVNHGPWELSANMMAGVKLLREYYVRLGSEKAAVISYNTGPGNYRKGNFRLDYWNKYKEHQRVYTTWLQRAETPSANDRPSGDRVCVLDLDDVDIDRSSGRVLLSSNREAGAGGSGRQDGSSYSQHCYSESSRESLGSLTGE
jgi:hypothetical protein